MNYSQKITDKRYKAYNIRNVHTIEQFKKLPPDILTAIRVVSKVLPFRASNYVIDELIDWDNIPDDPIFQLVFPQPGMLAAEDFQKIEKMMSEDPDNKEIDVVVKEIQDRMNPHPAGQLEMNIPAEDGKIYSGMQHKYGETVLFFPSQGQSCHAYCTYCFRWAQFVGHDDIKFATRDIDALIEYVEAHPEVTDVLITGGDPLIMSTKVIRRYVEPLMKQRPGNLSSIRFGTKVPAYWPYRFLSDHDADDLMELFDEIVESGLHLAVMTHFSHYRELETDAVKKALKRINATGAIVRCQAPLIRHINDDPEIWAKMWKNQVACGAIPYYMFVERDTGPKEYFSVGLARAYEIFTEAYKQVSGLSRTVRGPSMSANPGKVLISGVTELFGEKVFALKFIQGRDPEWVNKIFYAKYDEEACWLTDLKPAFGEKEFFFEKRLNQIKQGR